MTATLAWLRCNSLLLIFKVQSTVGPRPQTFFVLTLAHAPLASSVGWLWPTSAPPPPLPSTLGLASWGFSAPSPDGGGGSATKIWTSGKPLWPPLPRPPLPNRPRPPLALFAARACALACRTADATLLLAADVAGAPVVDVGGAVALPVGPTGDCPNGFPRPVGATFREGPEFSAPGRLGLRWRFVWVYMCEKFVF